jgi:spectinomycin phosphotransferase
MLEPPTISEESILACLREEFDLPVTRLEFLPLGADLNTAVYRAHTPQGAPYFVKLRSGAFEVNSVVVPKYLHDQGIPHILAPLAAKSYLPWAELGDDKVILYPFIEGVDGYQAALSAEQWVEFGATMKKIHSLVLHPDMRHRIPYEAYSPRARLAVREFLNRIEAESYSEPIAVQTAVFLIEKRGVVLDLLERAEKLARALQAFFYAPRETVLCHSDLHAGNLLIQPGGDFYIIDWDKPILALKERDLMFIGGAQGFVGYSAPEEETLFYRGYGQTKLDPVALSYYRCERILQDIAIFCAQLLGSTHGGRDREQWLRWLVSNFEPGGTIEKANRTS